MSYKEKSFFGNNNAVASVYGEHTDCGNQWS
jgi:hypothetical protein